VRRGIAGGRDEAKRLIGAGAVTVDGSTMVKASTLVADSAAITLVGDEPRWASRGALKLEHALGAFHLDPSGVAALDVGASTGGFTDVLLKGGAASVACVDVGYGQMVWRLSQDARVTVIDRTNFRTADPASLGGPFGLVVMDVSFISVRLLTSQLAAVGADDADYVVLVKPQFEVGRNAIGRGGIVTDPGAHADAVRQVASALAGDGIGAVDVVGSPITGSKGNREFLLHARLGFPPGLNDERIAEVTSP
jgi:23S rRNA (cytidine1920-2'-O)/16S rRNA (cytidine1409-2'-O)-methyltransferase